MAVAVLAVVTEVALTILLIVCKGVEEPMRRRREPPVSTLQMRAGCLSFESAHVLLVDLAQTFEFNAGKRRLAHRTPRNVVMRSMNSSHGDRRGSHRYHDNLAT